MDYFFLTGNKLLTETAFLNFVSKVNEAFAAMDTAAYEAHVAAGDSFTLDTKGWLKKCKDEKTTRMENGVMLNFRLFALSRISTFVNLDIDNYVKDHRAGKTLDHKKFTTELAAVREHILSAPYLEPISEALLEILDKIPADVVNTGKPVAAGPAEEGTDTLRWNGTLEDLCALFQDLRTRKSGKSDKAWLDYPSGTLEDFIAKHFRDADGKEFARSSVKLDVGPDKAGKKSGKKG